MADLPTYSPFFSCLYDEAAPVGNIGRGTHYSILESAAWISPTFSPLERGHVHRFAVVWDEDHDTRVIDALERIYMAGLLSSVLFAGERKGTLFLLLAREVDRICSPSELVKYRHAVLNISQGLEFDSWPTEIGRFEADIKREAYVDPAGIIHDNQEQVQIYLRNIHHLWKLGVRPYDPKRGTSNTFVAPTQSLFSA